MRSCFVPGCDKKCKQTKRTMFKVPKDKHSFEKWIHSLPKFKPLTEADRVCSLHFHSDDIQSTFYHIIEGTVLHIPRERPRLKLNAVPTLNIPSENELKVLKYTPKKQLKGTKKDTVINSLNDKSLISNKSKNMTKTVGDKNDIKNTYKKELNIQSVNNPIKYVEATVSTQNSLVEDKVKVKTPEKHFKYKDLYNKAAILKVECLPTNQTSIMPKQSKVDQNNTNFSATDLNEQTTKLTIVPYKNAGDIVALPSTETIPKPKKSEENHNIKSACTEEIQHQSTEVPIIAFNVDVASDELSTEASQSLNEQYQNFFDDIYEVELPNTLWGIHRCPERSIIIFSYMDLNVMQPTKMISIDTEGTIRIFSNKELLNVTTLFSEENSIQRVSKLLLELDQLN